MGLLQKEYKKKSQKSHILKIILIILESILKKIKIKSNCFKNKSQLFIIKK